MARNPTSSNNDPKKTADDFAPSREDEVLMREIDEAVRQDDAAEFVRKYGLAIGGAILVGLGGLGGYLWWDGQNEERYEASSEALVSALDSVQAGDFEGANEKTAPLLEGDDVEAGAKASAQFLQAAAALEQDDKEAATAMYKQLADDPDAPKVLRDFARIREVATGFDDMEPAAAIARLEDLAVPGNAFFGSAAELTAIAHLEAGDRDKAAELFAEISRDEELPETLRQRARQMAGLYGVDAVDDVEKLLREEGALPADGDSAATTVAPQ